MPASTLLRSLQNAFACFKRLCRGKQFVNLHCGPGKKNNTNINFNKNNISKIIRNNYEKERNKVPTEVSSSLRIAPNKSRRDFVFFR